MPGRSVASVLLLALHGLLCLQLVACAETGDDEAIEDGSSFHLPVVPPDEPEGAKERREHFRALEAKDLLRHEMIRMPPLRNGSRRQARETAKVPEVLSDTSMFAELPMRSAVNIAHVGMYLVSVRFGTPALPFNLALDTANDLTWINCRLRRRKGKHYGRQSPSAQTMSVGEDGSPVKKVSKNWYRPALSSSWRRVRCSQDACAKLPYNTCQSASQTASCSYHQKVQDGTVTIGIYGMEKATVALSDGKMAKLPGLIVGCSVLEAGGSVDAHDGVLSLGNGEISFGVIASSRFANRFSFCLLPTNSERNASSYLTFGPNPAVDDGPGTMETKIVYNNDIPVSFGFHINGITVGGELLDIPPEVWDDTLMGGGVILDTGTSVTGLVPPAYDAVTGALDRHLAHLPRVDIAGFEFCYNWTFTGDGVDPANNVTIPSFTVELDGGATLQADAKSVIMPEVDRGVACLAFRKLLLGGPSMVGNVLMQEHIWEFNHIRGMMKFRKDKCTNHRLNGNSSSNVHHTAPRFVN